MTMNWILDQARVQGKVVTNFVVDGNSLVPPKLLTLRATGIGHVNSFEILKYHDSAIRQILRYIKIPDITRFRPRIMLSAKEDGSGVYNSDDLWSLPTPRPELKKDAAFVFCADGGQNKSAVLYSTRKARSTVTSTWQSGAHGTAAMPYVPHVAADVTFGRVATGIIVWAVDPDMNVRVLTGAALAEHALNLVADAIEDDDELRGRFDAELEDLRQTLPFTYQGPDDWKLETPTSIHGDEGQTTEIGIDFSAASEGMGYFAFLLSDPESQDSDEVSSIFALEVTREGNDLALSVITDFDEMELRLPVV